MQMKQRRGRRNNFFTEILPEGPGTKTTITITTGGEKLGADRTRKLLGVGFSSTHSLIELKF